MSAKEAARPQEAEADKPVVIRAIDRARVRVLAEVVGEPRVVTLPDNLDPLEVLGNQAHWAALPANMFVVGARWEITNDSGSYLYEAWIRGAYGTAATGLRGIRFQPRVVWDERADAEPTELAGTGYWFVVYRGRYLLWQCVNPKGVVVGPSFNDEGAATTYMMQQQSNRAPR